MAVTQLGISNSALVKVGADRITDLAQNTKTAILLSTIFDSVRDEVLRSHPWRFAIKRATLTPTSTVPPFEYDFTYDLPNDCLRIVRLDDEQIDWVIEARKLLCSENPINVVYIYQNDEPSTWDTMFAEVMAWRLAAEISYNLTQSVTLFDRLELGYQKALGQARAMSGFEGSVTGFEATTWTDARR